MCVFCAAVPVAATVGTYANSKQRLKAQQAEAEGKTRPKEIISAGPATAMVIGGLVVCSVIVHTQLNVPF
jgi:hypothetical protein